MFLGDQLTAVVDHIIRGSDESVPSASIMRVGVSTLPFIRRDATDRNRTSPFAFTGNKFEFRMVPSSGCIADANTVLNTIAAEAFQAFADELEKAEDFEPVIEEEHYKGYPVYDDKPKKNKNNKIIIVVLVILIIAAIGAGVYVAKNGGIGKKEENTSPSVAVAQYEVPDFVSAGYNQSDIENNGAWNKQFKLCLLYTSPSPRDCS